MGKVSVVEDCASLALDYCYLDREIEMRKRDERHQFRFLAVPKTLLGRGLSSDVILLYSMMLERTWFSAENGWADELGRVYVIFTSKEIMNTFGCQSQKSAELIKTLEKLGLVEVDRSEKGRANRYFVKLIVEDLISSGKGSDNPANPFENQRGAALKFKEGVVRNSKPIDNTPNKPYMDLSKTKDHQNTVDDFSLDEQKIRDAGEDFAGDVLVPTVFSDGSKGFRIVYDDDCADDYCPPEAEKKDLRENRNPEASKALTLVQEVLVDFANRTGWFAKKKLRVNQTDVERTEVEKRLCSLTPEMIQYAAECLERRGDDLLNPKSYALTALFNAPDTYPLYQSMKIKHDGEGDAWYGELKTKARGMSARKRELKEAGVA